MFLAATKSSLVRTDWYFPVSCACLLPADLKGQTSVNSVQTWTGEASAALQEVSD